MDFDRTRRAIGVGAGVWQRGAGEGERGELQAEGGGAVK